MTERTIQELLAIEDGLGSGDAAPFLAHAQDPTWLGYALRGSLQLLSQVPFDEWRPPKHAPAGPEDYFGVIWSIRTAVLRAYATLDARELEAAALNLRVAGEGVPSELAARWEVTCTLLEAARGDFLGESGSARLAHQATAMAREAGATEEAIIAEVVASFASSALNEPHRTLQYARAASRMSRVEGRPLMEWVANLCLARARRVSGRPYLASKILLALRQLASFAWQPLVDLESIFAGMSESAALVPPSLASTNAAGLAKSLRTTTQELASEHALGTFSSQRFKDFFAHTPARVRCEVMDACAALVGATESASEPMRDWQLGRVQDVPWGLRLFASESFEQGEAPYAYIWARPEHMALRVLRAGRQVPSRFETTNRMRTSRALAVLLLAEGEVPIETFFEQLYGFAFVDDIHGGTLNSLIYDARQVIEALPLRLQRSNKALSLSIRGEVRYPDPHCMNTLEDRLLWLIGTMKGCGAKELSERTGIPLRSIQRSIRTLVETGVCQTSRDGREVRYQVVDTTFELPTGVELDDAGEGFFQ